MLHYSTRLRTVVTTRAEGMLKFSYMHFAAFWTRRKILVASAGIVFVLAVVWFFALSRPSRVPMEKYIPADALSFVEVDSLTDLIDGLTETDAWRGLAPLLGLSSQWRQVGSVTEAMGRTGIGPDEAVVLGRAQCALVVTAIDASTGETEEGPYLHIRPKVALVIETHLSPERASKLVAQRASILAARIFGDSIVETKQSYRDSDLTIFRANSDRSLVAASSGSVIVLANGEEPEKQCLDSVTGHTANLAGDPTFQKARQSLAAKASVVAFLTRSGLQKLVELAPTALGRAASAESVGAAVSLLEHLSDQAAEGLFYSAEFADGGVREKYLWSLHPQVAEGLQEAARPAPERSFDCLKLVPQDVDDVTLINLDRAGEFPERLLKQMAPRVDVVVAVALRELVKTFRKEYGLEGTESLGDAVGSEVALVEFGDGASRAMLSRVNDRPKVEALASRYLSRKGSSVTTVMEKGVEVTVASGEDHRAAAFVGGFLVLGTREQIARVIGAFQGEPSLSPQEPLRRFLSSVPAGASMLSYSSKNTGAGELMLALSKVLRVSDGSREILERQQVRDVVNRLPRSASFTEVRDSGIYIEEHSAVGSFRRLSALVGND